MWINPNYITEIKIIPNPDGKASFNLSSLYFFIGVNGINLDDLDKIGRVEKITRNMELGLKSNCQISLSLFNQIFIEAELFYDSYKPIPTRIVEWNDLLFKLSANFNSYEGNSVKRIYEILGIPDKSKIIDSSKDREFLGIAFNEINIIEEIQKEENEVFFKRLDFAIKSSDIEIKSPITKKPRRFLNIPDNIQ